MGNHDQKIETLFPGSKIQDLGNGRKKVTVALRNCFSIQPIYLVSQKTGKKVGAKFVLLHKGQPISSDGISLYHDGDNLRALVEYVMDAVWGALVLEIPTDEYKIHLIDQDFVSVINRCFKEMKATHAVNFTKLFGNIKTVVTIEDIKANRISHRNDKKGSQK